MPRPLQHVVVPVPDDLTIAQGCTPLPISVIAEELGLTRDDYDEHGKQKAKVRVRREQAERRARTRRCAAASRIEWRPTDARARPRPRPPRGPANARQDHPH